MSASVIAEGGQWQFWLIGDQVYRAALGSVMDIYGCPASRRWECSISHWRRYRGVYDWAKDTEAAA